MAQDNDTLLDHNYDGIQEYDNPLPNWWLLTFAGTVIFAFIYVFHYQLGGGPNLSQELKEDMSELQAVVAAKGPVKGGLTNDDLAKAFADSQNVSAGKEVFAGKCASCHGEQGQGLVFISSHPNRAGHHC